MDKKEFSEKIKVINEQIEKLQNEQKKLLDSYVMLYCPYKIGDVAICRGYSFRDKAAKISRIYGVFDWNDLPCWKVKGYAVKKDGSVGNQEVRWDEEQEKDAKRKD